MTLALVLGWLRRIPWQAWAIVALLATVAVLRWHWIGVGEDRTQARWDAQEAVYARQRAEAVIAARKVEERHRAEYRAIAERFLADQRKADEVHDRAIADLRRGALRVRSHLTCPSGRAEAPADPGVADGASQAGLLPADAEFLLREAARADEIARRLNALQAAVRAGQR